MGAHESGVASLKKVPGRLRVLNCQGNGKVPEEVSFGCTLDCIYLFICTLSLYLYLVSRSGLRYIYFRNFHIKL